MERTTSLDLAIEALPVEGREAYSEVSKRRPDLVLSESNPDWFLRANQQRVEPSAAGLVTYWSERKNTFGEERFARPLRDLSGDGALLPKDVQLLQSGFMTILPPDSHGRHVICIDSSRVTQQVDRMSYARMCFFVGHCLLQLRSAAGRATATTELVLVRRLCLTMLKNPAAVSPHLDRSLRIFEEVLPLEVHSLHNCLAVKQSVKLQRIVATTIPPVMSRIGKGLAAKAALHAVKSPEEIAIKLQEKGIIHLPEKFGGTWSYSNFDSWMESVSQQPKTVDPKDCEDKTLMTVLEGFVGGYKTDVEVVNHKAHFAFGALGMLQEEEKRPLRELLGQNETQEILLDLCGQPIPLVGDLLKECVSEVAAEQGSLICGALKDVSEELLDELTGGSSATVPMSTETSALQALQVENAELVLQLSNLIGERLELPVPVQSCLDVLLLLEEEQRRTLSDMLQDTSVIAVLDKILAYGDSDEIEGDTELELAILDILAQPATRI